MEEYNSEPFDVDDLEFERTAEGVVAVQTETQPELKFNGKGGIYMADGTQETNWAASASKPPLPKRITPKKKTFNSEPSEERLQEELSDTGNSRQNSQQAKIKDKGCDDERENRRPRTRLLQNESEGKERMEQTRVDFNLIPNDTVVERDQERDKIAKMADKIRTQAKRILQLESSLQEKTEQIPEDSRLLKEVRLLDEENRLLKEKVAVLESSLSNTKDKTSKESALGNQVIEVTWQ